MLVPSSITNFLTTDFVKESFNPFGQPNSWFNIIIVESDNKVIFNRKVYSFMGVLEDIGGLYGSFELIGILLFSSYAEFLLSNTIVNENFEFIDTPKSKEIDP